MIPIFRAWDKVNEEMLNVDIIDLFLEEIRVLKDDGTVFAMKFRNIELMQSTGLKDRNGVEIYEGDIVKPLGFARWIGMVAYSKENAAYILDDHNNDFRKGENIYLSEFAEGLEIIGNIYENPELLEK